MSWVREALVRHRLRKAVAAASGGSRTPAGCGDDSQRHPQRGSSSSSSSNSNTSSNNKHGVVDTVALLKDPHGGHLLELHCGVGTLTCALAPLFARTLATELNPRSVRALLDNLRRNGLDATVVCGEASAEVRYLAHCWCIRAWCTRAGAGASRAR